MEKIFNFKSIGAVVLEEAPPRRAKHLLVLRTLVDDKSLDCAVAHDSYHMI